MKGTTFGKRTFNWVKKFKIYERKYNIYCEIKCNADGKGFVSGLFGKKKVQVDAVRGKIWQCHPEFIEKLIKKEKVKFNEKTHTIRELSTVEGIWTDHLEFNGKRSY